VTKEKGREERRREERGGGKEHSLKTFGRTTKTILGVELAENRG
jgi:hypothetical protein